MTFTPNNPNGYVLRGYPDSEVRIAAFDGPGDEPICGWYKVPFMEEWGSTSWGKDGRYVFSGQDSYDLIDKPAPKQVVEVWGYVWTMGDGYSDINTYDTQQHAIFGRAGNINAGYKCSPVELFEREVEGP